MFGKKGSQKQKDAVRKALKGKPRPDLSAHYKERYANGTHTLPEDTKGANNGMARAVVYKGVEYPTVGEAAKGAGVSRVTAGKKLKAQHPDWRYKGGQNLHDVEK